MNILPKKRWHVRTKENIARVRRDEAEAAEEERQEKLRTENADREARLRVLKQKSKQKLLDAGVPESSSFEACTTEHINLFANFDSAVKSKNVDHEIEAKEKKEEYEKKIGYLTYLGQDTNEALGKRNWYEIKPEQSRFSRSSDIRETYDRLVLKDEYGKPRVKETETKDGEVAWRSKQYLDPINTFKKYSDHKSTVKTKSSKNSSDHYNKIMQSEKREKKKKHKKTKEDKSEILKKLREARLRREQQEKHKTKMFLSSFNNSKETVEPEPNTTRVKPKYNSQFNPELARQNYK